MDNLRSYGSLIRIVRRLAAAISLVVTVALPAILGVHTYLDLVGHSRIAARVSAERVGQYAFIQGETWRFSAHRIAELIGSSANALNMPRQYVEYADGSPVVDIGEPLTGPKVAGVWPIIVLGETVGVVHTEASLLPLLWHLCFLTLVGGMLGGFAYIVIDRMPLQALQRVTDDLQKTQAELASAHARLAEAIEVLPDGFALFDAQDRLTLCNRRYLDIFHLSEGDIARGTTFEELVRKSLARGHYPALTGNEEDWIAERVRQHRNFDGIVEQELSDGRVLRVADRSMADGSRVGIRTDITELRKSEAERVLLRDQFHQAQQLQALGTLAGGVAHDFNNILAIVIGHAELIEIEVPADSPARGAIQEIIQASERGAQLVKQILAYTRREQTAYAPVRLDDILREEFSLLRATLPATVELRLAPTPIATVTGNRTQLHQILMNLCVNAGHAIGTRPGAIDIGLEAVDVQPKDPAMARLLRAPSGEVERMADGHTLLSCIGTLSPGRHWRLCVSDSGCGMEADVLRRIFEPFFTTRDVGAGTGLGLAAVSGIVTGMNGAVVVRTVPGRGSTFEIYLPDADAPAAADPAASPQPIGAGQNLRVLFVDDEPGLVTMGEQQFRAQGYTVAGLTDPHAALRRFRAAPEAWDLIVTDCTMPGMTGVELAREILSLRPGIPIILCSGYGEAFEADAVKQLGIREVLTKPVRREELLAAAARAMAAEPSSPAPRGA